MEADQCTHFDRQNCSLHKHSLHARKQGALDSCVIQGLCQRWDDSQCLFLNDSCWRFQRSVHKWHHIYQKKVKSLENEADSANYHHERLLWASFVGTHLIFQAKQSCFGVDRARWRRASVMEAPGHKTPAAIAFAWWWKCWEWYTAAAGCPLVPPAARAKSSLSVRWEDLAGWGPSYLSLQHTLGELAQHPRQALHELSLLLSCLFGKTLQKLHGRHQQVVKVSRVLEADWIHSLIRVSREQRFDNVLQVSRDIGERLGMDGFDLSLIGVEAVEGL